MKRIILLILAMLLSLNAIAGTSLIAIVEQEAGKIDFYEQNTFEHVGGVKVGYIPHEVAISGDGKTAYVANFGLHDDGWGSR